VSAFDSVPSPPQSPAGRIFRLAAWSPFSIRLQAAGLSFLNLLSSRRRAPGASERILVVKLDGIGDYVLLTPFLAELRRVKPGAWITLVTTATNLGLARAGAPVDQILCAPTWRGRLRHWLDFVRFAFRELRPLRPTLAIIPRWDVDLYDAHPLVLLSGARRRVSYSVAVNAEKQRLTPRGDRFLTQPIRSPSLRHEVENHLALLRAIGLEARPCPTHLAPLANRDVIVNRVLPDLGESTLVALCPFSAEPIKNWPLSRFLEVARSFERRPDLHFCLLAAHPVDLGQLQPASNLTSLAGLLSLDEIAALLTRCRLLLTVDTGVMHIAAAMSCPTVVVHGLASDHEPESHYSTRRFGPWMADWTLVAPLAHERGPRRIDAVTVAQVVTALEARLPRAS
jgi:heptosyltransferase-2